LWVNVLSELIEHKVLESFSTWHVVCSCEGGLKVCNNAGQ